VAARLRLCTRGSLNMTLWVLPMTWDISTFRSFPDIAIVLRALADDMREDPVSPRGPAGAICAARIIHATAAGSADSDPEFCVLSLRTCACQNSR